MMIKTGKNSGNALWFILIAIFLLGGLTVLLTRTGSQTGETGDTERSAIQISNIIKYVQGVEAAVGNLRMHGCSETQISFDYDSNADYDNPNSPPDHSCEVFHVNGGGMTRKDVSSMMTGATDLYTAASSLNGIGTFGCGTAACNDLYWTLIYTAVDTASATALCNQINKQVKATSLISAAPTSYMLANPTVYFKGVYGPYHNASAAAFKGLKSACFVYSTAPQNVILWYYVLLAR